MDTLFADVSKFQNKPVDRSYPFKFVSFRGNDGTYLDSMAGRNLSAVRRLFRRQTNRLIGFAVYFVFELNWRETADAFLGVIGSIHRPRMAVVLDLESWGGKITGNHGVIVKACREYLIHRLNGMRPKWQRTGLFRPVYLAMDRRRVSIYGNAGDLNTLAGRDGLGDAWIWLADYTRNAPFPNKLVHQFTSKATVPPWGYPVDLNSADKMGPRTLARRLGLGMFRWTI